MGRKTARELAKEFIEKNQPLDWFEELYKKADQEDLGIIPWADLEPNPNLVELVNDNNYKGIALIIGCGLGDDAEYIQEQGLEVDAFDISETAIKICKSRFPKSAVNYFVADAIKFKPKRKYDLIIESYTLQVLPVELRQKLIKQLPEWLNNSGVLIVICRGRDKDEFAGAMPFPLTREELKPIEENCKLISFEDYFDKETPPVRRFRIKYQKK